ncbi:PilC/PilY family type IV pilus protein [Thiobaca trueperi]|uniref:Type IV pilus assembly protein PilY1 n=1 Tax=Thiobaca trueperi TaxID=127458 RepID=A0A4R3N1G0_9GAMM|nr:PilC/PilY family type IV pilus protein [Thiobaca trueperi]TCT22888.1 type IV pilus assembly protein PilY1 [Thiobaca trueperi]
MRNRGRRFMLKQPLFPLLLGALLIFPAAFTYSDDASLPPAIAQTPLFMGGGIDAPPLTMLVMGRDHTLYYEAYNDASDLNGDNVLDVGYKPNAGFDYFGYFDSYLCYTYSDNRFTPDSTTTNKKCPGKWSGDFLNYITTTRIDALRKVLYGGHRIVDTTTETVLERAYIPQDAHSWGKEYHSIARDGYDIRDYTPLSLPTTGTRHLIANTTLLKTGSKEPLMRVLPNSKFRIWEWVAIERPVAGTKCVSGDCETSSTTQTASHPNNSSEFQALVDAWGNDDQKCGSGAITGGNISNSGSNKNPFSGSNGCAHDYYMTVIRGQIYAPTEGNYLFATNGDDAVEVLIDNQVITGWYGGHGRRGDSNIETRANNTGSVVTKTLTAGWHDIEFRHEEMTGDDNWELLWKPANGVWAIVPATSFRKSADEPNVAPTITTYKLKRDLPASKIADYVVRVQVCKSSDLLDKSCKTYTDTTATPNTTTYKPDGLLQKYGNTDKMMFGLMSGSFTHPYNMRGGVLRKNIESFTNEIDLKTGIFKENVDGIVQTINKFRIVDFNMDQSYQYNDGWLTTESMSKSNSKFPDWGNPLAEMMYETLRYFSGKTTATADFTPTPTDGKERVTLRDYSGSSTMDLPMPSWQDPYLKKDTLYCSPAAQLLISDVNPSFDTEYVPGSAWGSFSGDISGLNVKNEADAIWTAEYGSGSSMHFIGQVGDNYDGAPTAKSVSGLGNIRGLSPAEPTKQGGYYSAGIARYGFLNDLRTNLTDKQDINTFSVALASPLPKIVIPVDGKLVTVVPFAKSVGGSSINAEKSKFQPTNTIVDFFIEEFANTDPKGSDANANINEGRPSIKFRINYEDVEQGADHDMDAIVLYDLKVNADKTLTISLDSSYAAGGIMQHIGYVVSGTTNDGVYLEVRDKDTSENEDPAYFLNTPAGLVPGACDVATPPSTCKPLPLQASRTFTASNSADVATVLENPLWYAAKYGSEGNSGLKKGQPSLNYFLVTNAGNLQKQLEDAFTRIILLSKSTAASIAASSSRATNDAIIYQASFDSNDWSGDLIALKIFGKDASKTPIWSAEKKLPNWNKRKIYSWSWDTDTDETLGIPLTWDDLNAPQKNMLAANETSQKALLNWVYGDHSQESASENGAGFRHRTKILGDIINSDPLYVGKPTNLGYAKLPTGTPGQDTYLGAGGFIDTYKDRSPMIYVGANDGMLHAFDAETGVEKFAYAPNAVLPNLANLASKTYQHRYFVDGSPSVGDACVNVGDDDCAWRSVLVGTLGAGGRTVFALDVTDPDNFDESNVLWEFTDTDLGYMVGQMTSSPVIGRLQNGKWAAIFGSGYFGNGSDTGTGASLYIVDLDDGSLIKKIQVSNDNMNGLSAVALIRDGQQTIAGAYAGDLKGNLWKFDLTGTSADDWGIAYGAPLFQAVNGDGVAQPITDPLDVGIHPSGGYLVFFGTGQYMRATDPADKTVQTAYGIWDNAILGKDTTETTKTVWKDGSAITAGRSALQKQEIIFELKIASEKENWRVISKNSIDWGTRASPVKRGWYIDLTSPDPNTAGARIKQGERIISRPQILSGSGLVLFTTLVPVTSTDPCQTGGGESWILAVDMFTGARSEGPTFDVNGDKKFDENDTRTVTIDGKEVVVPLSGFRLDQIIDSPRALLDGDDYTLVTAGSNGEEAKESGRVDGSAIGRQGWRQLR